MKILLNLILLFAVLTAYNSCRYKGETALQQEIPKHEAEINEQADRVEQQIHYKSREFVVEGVSFEVSYCPPGSFMMGSQESEAERESDEHLHEVEISKGFWMMETEVTQELYEAVTGNNPAYFKGNLKPVEMVNWHEAVNFCIKLSELTGQTWELPTEAEWEYACRAGTNTPYHFGYTLDPGLANYDPSYGLGSMTLGEQKGMTMDVKSFSPNAWGLYDMHGNVWEWCYDYYYEYPQQKIADPKGPEKGSKRVMRGGSWYAGAGHTRSANRGSFIPEFRNNNFGLRVVLRTD